MSSINNHWELRKTVLPQHTDHAGVMWHGSYLDFLEEGRIDALDKVGISYSELSNKGFEIPVISIQLRYKISFIHGEKVLLQSQFKLENKIRLTCKTLFLKSNGDIGAEAIIGLVVARKKNDSIKLVRELPVQIKNIEKTIAQGINSGITKMSEVLAKSIVFGEKILGSFREMARTLLASVLTALIEIVARKGVELAIEKMITREKQKQASLSAVSGGSSLFSMAKSFLGFAKGGAVSKGQPVVVGEQGAEVFVPNSTGQITQSARGTGGGQTTVNFNINTLDASGFDDLLVRSRGTITQLINNAVNERGKESLI